MTCAMRTIRNAVDWHRDATDILLQACGALGGLADGATPSTSTWGKLVEDEMTHRMDAVLGILRRHPSLLDVQERGLWAL